MMNKECDLSFCQKLPKVELHAHANGSLSDETVSQLLKRSGLNYELSSMIIEKGEQRTMSEGFEMFKIIQQLVNNCEVLFQCVKTVISDFAADGVKYLELRSTPRDVELTGMTKRLYIETVLNAIQSYLNESKQEIDVRYLPSIDRKFSVENAYEVIKLAEEFMLSHDNFLVGIDFSGNPYVNDGADYFEPLVYAKKTNLKVAVHLAEVDGRNNETKKLLQLPPDRIGHGTYLLNDKSLWGEVLQKKIPLEICMTSNVKTGTAPPAYDKHHLVWWYTEHNHPCILGTDDKGIFATTLSKEYATAANVLGLTQKDVYNWSKQSIDYIFSDQTTKDKLVQTWNDCSKFLWEEN